MSYSLDKRAKKSKTKHDPTRHDTGRHDTTRHGTTRHDTTRHDTGGKEKKERRRRKIRVIPDLKTREAASLANAVALPIAVHKTPTPIH